VDAQKLLSAVYRTDQRFGALHVIAVLRGDRTDAVVQWGHDKLPVFGVGADRPAQYWRGVVRQLIALGALDMHIDGKFATLVLVTERARPILRGEQVVKLRDEPTVPRGRTEKPRAAATSASTPVSPGDADRFERLRAWRAQEARSQGVPPYVIFHDSTLREIAALRADDVAMLSEVKGVGASKRARYGAAVLAVLRG
jgi:ATP-dependent DNA helicase RecQ